MTDTRERILAAAAELTTEVGWGRVTMSRVASRVGVSRQTVYNEFGPKQQLAEEMVIHELGRFLSRAAEEFGRHPTDLAAALRASNRAILQLAAYDRTLHAILSASYGRDAELLPLLTTNGAHLQETAQQALLALMAPYRPPVEREGLETVADLLVRMILSHGIRPSLPPDEAADRITWLACRVLGI